MKYLDRLVLGLAGLVILLCFAAIVVALHYGVGVDVHTMRP